MDTNRFDGLVKSLASRRNRRDVLKGLFGAGAAVSAVSLGLDGADAARRGFSGPKLPCTPTCGENSCGASDGCGGICATCPGGKICLVNGTCATPCSEDADCAPCLICEATADGGGSFCGQFRSTIDCDTTPECPAGSVCSAIANTCTEVCEAI